MSEIKFEDKGDGTFYLRNVPLVYTAMRTPKTMKDDQGVEHKKYEVTAIIPEEIADEIDAAGFDKPSSRKILIKKGDKTFEERYHMDRPDWVAAAKHWQFILRARAEYKDKESGEMKLFEHFMKARPKMYFKNAEGKIEDYTDKLIGNGSVGDLYFTTFTTKHGTNASIAAIMLTDVVEVEMNDSVQNPFAEYGDIPAPVFPEKEEATEQKQETKAPANPPAAEDFDSDVPF